jgi:hypothetical protein
MPSVNVAAVAGRAGVGPPPRIAVPAGLADRPAGHEEPRPGQVALGDALANAPVGAARVAHGREAAVEHRAHEGGAARRHQGERDRFRGPDVDLGQEDVDVAVDQPGHQGAPAGVEREAGGDLDRSGRHLTKPLALDDDRGVLGELARHGVQQGRVPDQDHGSR